MRSDLLLDPHHVRVACRPCSFPACRIVLLWVALTFFKSVQCHPECLRDDRGSEQGLIVGLAVKSGVCSNNHSIPFLLTLSGQLSG